MMADEELNTSFARLQRIDLDDMDDIIGSKACWVDKVKRKLEVEEEHNLTDDVSALDWGGKRDHDTASGSDQ